MKLVEDTTPSAIPSPAAPQWRAAGRFVACWWPLVAIVLAATVACWSMRGLGMLAGHSEWLDLARVVEFDAAIRAEDFFPTWSPDLYAGYGSPLFQFYAPLAYCLAEGPILAGVDYVSALKMAQCLALLGSGLAMYRLGRPQFSRGAACLGALFYMIAPYRMVDIYIRHALAEHCAFVWLPLIVWGTKECIARRSRAGFAVGVISAAGLILTHNIMAMIGLPMCLTAGWVLGVSRRRIAWSLGAGAGIAVLGVGLAAVFWWPAMSGRPLTMAEASLTGGYFDFHRHFVSAWLFLDPHWRFGFSTGQPGAQIPLQIGMVHLSAVVGALAMWLGFGQGEGDAGRRRRIWSGLAAAIVALGVLMCSGWSRAVWETLPPVKYVQFPWRFLGLVVLGSSLCAMAVADRLAAMSVRAAWTTFLAGLALVLAIYFPCYTQPRFLVADSRTGKVLTLPGAEVRALQSAGFLTAIGRGMNAAQLRQMNERATSSDDFLPRGVKEKPTQPPGQMVLAQGGRVLELTRPGQNHYRVRLQMPAPGKAALLQFWFPGWEAALDGAPLPTAPTGRQAVVTCEVPGGEHVVEFRYTALPQRRAGWIVSLISLALAVCIFVMGARWRRKEEGAPA